MARNCISIGNEEMHPDCVKSRIAHEKKQNMMLFLFRVAGRRAEGDSGPDTNVLLAYCLNLNFSPCFGEMGLKTLGGSSSQWRQ